MRGIGSVVLCICLFLFKATLAQQEHANATIGEPLPTSFWELQLEVMDSSATISTVSLKDYQQTELLIVDFWGYSCSACREGLDRLSQIKSGFSDDQLMVLPVHIFPHELGERYGKYAVRAVKQHAWRFPTVVNDSLLYDYFKHAMVGFGDVWIHKGKLLSIPVYGYLHERAIRCVLEGNDVTMVNQSQGKPVKALPTLFADADMLDSNKRWNGDYGVIGSRIKDADGGPIRFEVLESGQTVLYAWNRPIADLLLYAFSDQVFPFLDPAVACEWHVRPATQGRWLPVFDKADPMNSIPARIRWQDDHWFGYQAFFRPGTTESEAKKYLQADLVRFLGQTYGLRPVVEKGPIKRYAVLDYDTRARLPQMNLEQSFANSSTDTASVFSTFSSVKANLAAQLDRLRSESIPLVDSTGIDPRWLNPIVVPNPDHQVMTISALNSILKPFGLKLTIHEQAVNRLVIYDN